MTATLANHTPGEGGIGDVHGDLTQKVLAITQRSRQLHAELLDTVTQLRREDTAQALGYSNLATLLSDLLRITPAAAGKLIRHAHLISEDHTPTGATTPAPLPIVSDAVRDGAISADHIDVISTVIDKIPDWAPPGTTHLVEHTLTTSARVRHPAVVRTDGNTLLARIDQDGQRPRDEVRQDQPSNTLRTSRTLDGRMRLTGELDSEAAEELTSLLDGLARPHNDTPGVPDPRSQTERNGDALADIIHRAINTPDLPQRGGEKPRLTALLSLDTLVDGVGTATLDSGCPLAPSAARRLACDAQILPMVMNGNSVPLDVGRTHRLVTPAQRAALSARDRGCAFPNCDRPARWTDAHHVQSWIDGGTTDLHNLVLLCRRHHRTIHHSDWVVQIINGLPEFTPPRWLDPDQTPLRNTPTPEREQPSARLHR